jgi:tetratricopeptide (TPR) repeat protein
MSRSVHATRHELRSLLLDDFADPGERRKRVRAINAARRTKRTIKNSVEAERARLALPTADGIASADAIPIRVRDEGPFLHYPASPGDLRAVMSILPPGLIDHVSRIELCLIADDVPIRGVDERDPLVRRIGAEILPGVWAAAILGSYAPSTSVIRLSAFVSQSPLELWQVYLRLQMLSTFVHELAHHHDHRERTARGRWRADTKSKSERYARRREFLLLNDYVVQYVARTYPDGVTRCLDWIAYHGGVDVPLARLLQEHAPPDRSGEEPFVLATVRSALSELIANVDKSNDPVSTRIDFAEQLHFAEQNDLALSGLRRVIDEHPQLADAWRALACIYRCTRDWDQARLAAERAVALDPASAAWEILAQACEAQSDWQHLLDAADHALSLAGAVRLRRWRALMQCARANIELGHWEEAQAYLETLATLEHPVKREYAKLRRLRAELMARAAAEP